MDELRFERRDGETVIVATNSGDEFALMVDDTLLAEVRSAHRAARHVKSVKPAEIQKLIRAGKSLDEITELTGADDEDIERYAAPVRAELDFILKQAQSVPVRTSTHSDSAPHQKFGEVLAERLIGLAAERVNWSSWRDPDVGWLVALEFHSRGVDHRAIWAYNHRTQVLTPRNTDAVNLSKQADPGDRLIPRLRAVDQPSDASPDSTSPTVHTPHIDPSHTEAPADAPAADAPHPSPTPRTSGSPVRSGHPVGRDEYERRRNIDDLAVTRGEQTPPDLGETQDLLEQLRRRRGEREQQGGRGEGNALFSAPGVTGSSSGTPEPAERPGNDVSAASQGTVDPKSAVSRFPTLFGGSEDNDRASTHDSDAATRSRGSDGAESVDAVFDESEWFGDGHATADQSKQRGAREESGQGGDAADWRANAAEPQHDSKPDSKKKRGRTAIPSWDDILFGTRSADEPREP